MELHLAAFTRINSSGVREWVNFVRDLVAVSELSFTHCSPRGGDAAQHDLQLPRPRARCSSSSRPTCARRAVEEHKLLDVGEHFPDAADVPAFRASAAAAMEFDDLPERYLSFLSEAELADG